MVVTDKGLGAGGGRSTEENWVGEGLQGGGSPGRAVGGGHNIPKDLDTWALTVWSLSKNGWSVTGGLKHAVGQ